MNGTIGYDDIVNPHLSSTGKYINDPIHGHIYLPDYVVDFIDTPEFQRLRDLKQMGTCYYVYPGATHNRFEHCIGTSHLSGELIERLKQTQPELDISQRDVACVRLAGLCHDLGHGPFSHVFDNEFLPRSRPGIKWEHEQASEMMLEHLVDNNAISAIDLSTSDVQFIKDLIRGRCNPSNERGFLFEIVNNKRNSVDVDKFDYIQRDCYNTGKKSSYDISRLMTFSRVIDNQICYDQKEVYNLYELFRTRYSLFKQVYTHRGGKAVEYMVVDALLAADPYLHISQAIDDPKEYLLLTDAIIKEIERSKAPELQASRDIIHRIRTRDLYKFVDSKVLPSTIDIQRVKSLLTPQSIIAHSTTINGTPQEPLKESDFVIEWVNINYAMKDQNPVDYIRFYSKYNPNISFHIDRTTVSYLVPEMYSETVVRVFSKHVEKCKQVQDAFREVLSDIANEWSLEGSPVPDETRMLTHIDTTSSVPTKRPTPTTPTKNNDIIPIYTLSSSPKRGSSPTKINWTGDKHLTLPNDFGSPRKKMKG